MKKLNKKQVAELMRMQQESINGISSSIKRYACVRVVCSNTLILK